MNKRNKLKTLVFSLGLAAMMVPATLNAQINRGLLQNPYKSQDDSRCGMLNQNRSGEGSTMGNETFGAAGSEIGNEAFGAPIGGGIGILLAAGMGYAFIQSKKNKQN